MPPELWEPNLKLLFVAAVATEPSSGIGFFHLHPKDRFWGLLELNGITPKRVITVEERKALTEGQKQGSVSDPVRAFFIEKKTSQLLKLGIGLTDLNRRLVVENEKQKEARPVEGDIREFIARVEDLKPGIVAFVMQPEVFVGAFRGLFPAVTDTPGRQVFTIGGAEVWLLGSTVALIRGEALQRQDDAFFALGERLEGLVGEAG
jgi:G:T/U-mismatch repair DNA glycosylase